MFTMANSGTRPWVRSSSLSLPPQRRRDFYSLLYIGADYDTELKSTAASDKGRTHVLHDRNIITAAPSVSVSLVYCSSRIVPTYRSCSLSLSPRRRLLVRSKGKPATSSRVTTELKIARGMFKQGALADETLSVSTLNTSVTRKSCPGQILMVMRPVESSTLLSRLSATLTCAGLCTLMLCRQAASMLQETARDEGKDGVGSIHDDGYGDRFTRANALGTDWLIYLVSPLCLFFFEFKPIRLMLRTDTPFILPSPKKTSRPDSVWPDMWNHVSDAAKSKAKQKSIIDKPKLENARRLRGIFFIEPEDEELTHIIKNGRRKLEIPMPAAMPCKTPVNCCGVNCSSIGKRKTKFACIVDTDESVRLRLEGVPHRHHEDHIAAEGMNSQSHYNMVHKFIPMPGALKIPVQRKQWKNNVKQLTKVRNKKGVIDEARNKGSKVLFVSLMDLCHLKNSDLDLQYQKYNGRVVLRGDIVKNDSGSYAVFTESGSSASQMTPAKVMDILSRLPGRAGQAADAGSGETQVKMEDAPKLLKIPKSERPDIWIRLPRHKWFKIMVQYGRSSRSS